MSIHPNVILMAVLTPDNLARKTYRDILQEHGIPPEKECPEIKIGEQDFNIQVMEESYDESYQISASQGDIVLHDLVTYGYGEKISWADLVKKESELEEWCKRLMEKHRFTYRIFVSANYW